MPVACGFGGVTAAAGDHAFAVAVGEDVIARDTLTATLDSATHGKKDERIYLRADKAVSYGDLMEVMNLLRNAGYLKIALVGLDGRS